MGILFSKEHIWVCVNDENATLGISDYAQKQLGAVMFLNLPEIGEKLEIGKRFGDIETIKTVTDLISPVEGEVVNVNGNLLDEPDLVNEDPYGSWLVEVRCFLPETAGRPEKPAGIPVLGRLMDEDTYLRCKDEL